MLALSAAKTIHSNSRSIKHSDKLAFSEQFINQINNSNNNCISVFDAHKQTEAHKADKMTLNVNNWQAMVSQPSSGC